MRGRRGEAERGVPRLTKKEEEERRSRRTKKAEGRRRKMQGRREEKQKEDSPMLSAVNAVFATRARAMDTAP